MHELLVKGPDAKLPTRYGEFLLTYYKQGKHVHPVLVMGSVAGKERVLVRLHSECLTGDAFGSLRCDCGQQLESALRMIAEEKCGVLLYMRQEGRGIGLENKINAYCLQDKGADTVEANEQLNMPADSRDYGFAAGILADLGVKSARLLTNNPKKMQSINSRVPAVERIPLVVQPNHHSAAYLTTKKVKLGHLL